MVLPTCLLFTAIKFAALVVVSLSGTICSPVHVHLLPVSIVAPLYFTVTPIFVNSTLHSALHSVTTDTSECEFNPVGVGVNLHPLVGCAGRVVESAEGVLLVLVSSAIIASAVTAIPKQVLVLRYGG